MEKKRGSQPDGSIQLRKSLDILLAKGASLKRGITHYAVIVLGFSSAKLSLMFWVNQGSSLAGGSLSGKGT